MVTGQLDPDPDPVDHDQLLGDPTCSVVIEGVNFQKN
jgi:hypothetical protein